MVLDNADDTDVFFGPPGMDASLAVTQHAGNVVRVRAHPAHPRLTRVARLAGARELFVHFPRGPARHVRL